MARQTPRTSFLGLPLTVAGHAGLQAAVARGFQIIDDFFSSFSVAAEDVTFDPTADSNSTATTVAEALDEMEAFVSGVEFAIPSPYDVLEGEGVFTGDVLFGIAQHDAPTGQFVTIRTEGVVEIAKNPASEFTVGQIVYFDVDTKRVDDSPAVGEWNVGWAIEDAPAATTTLLMRIVPNI